MKVADITKGCENMAQRIVSAEEAFISTLMTLGEINIIEARRVLAHYRILKLVKTDAVGGRMTVKHGALLDRETIRRAVSL